jgi:hypothetical protein
MDSVIPFTRQQRIINSLILNGSFVDSPGLMHGKTGIAIYFYHLARNTGNTIYEEYAGGLIDEIYKEIHSKTYCDFENGLAGIGWGIEYLIRNKFIEADSNDVLEDIDNRLIHEVTFHPPGNIGLLYGICGYIFYFLNRLLSNSPQSKSYVFIHKALVNTVALLQQHIKNYPIDTATDKILNEPEVFTLTWEYPCILWILAELKNAGVCRKQSETWIKKLILPLKDGSFIPKLQSHRLLLTLILERIKQGHTKNGSIHIPENLNGKLIESIQREIITEELEPGSAFLYHGTMGISYIYNWLFKVSQDPYYKNESEYWKSIGFSYPESEQAYAGFYVKKEDEKSGYGILNGITGIEIYKFLNYS